MSIQEFATAEPFEPDEETQAAAPATRRAPARLLRHPSALAGMAVLGLFVLATLIGPLLLHYDPAQQQLSDARLGSSPAHLLGTDQLGRDELTRLLFGARYSLSLGFFAVVIGVAVGVPLGAISGYFGGWIDLALQRITDVMLAFPNILLALALVAVLGVGLRNVIISVGISSVPLFVRLVRSSALSIRELPYVEAARASGTRDGLIILRHVLPNSIAPVIVQGTVQLGTAILIASGLGFLGLGVQAPTPEWGAMLGEARNDIFNDPNLATFPGLAIFLAVLAFNLLGDGLRDALDPRLSHH